MIKRFRTLFAAAALTSCAVALPAVAETESRLNPVDAVFEAVRQNFRKDVSKEDFMARFRAALRKDMPFDRALRHTINSYDAHSTLYSPSVANGLMQSLAGHQDERYGFAVGLNKANQAVIIRVTQGSPADLAGLVTGDQIVAINGAPIGKDNFDRSFGSSMPKEVSMTIRRRDVPISFEVRMKKGNFEDGTVSARQIDARTVHLKISQFNDLTPMSLAFSVMKYLREGRVDRFVLDLRDNPGGTLQSAVEVINLLAPKGTQFHYAAAIRYKDRLDGHPLRPAGMLQGKRMVVLVNGRSASASEVVAGALQDFGFPVIGECRQSNDHCATYGKGSVQVLKSVEGVGTVRITEGFYLTPAGRSPQFYGVIPNIAYMPNEKKPPLYREVHYKNAIPNPAGKNPPARELARTTFACRAESKPVSARHAHLVEPLNGSPDYHLLCALGHFDGRAISGIRIVGRDKKPSTLVVRSN